jgi:predicted permease
MTVAGVAEEGYTGLSVGIPPAFWMPLGVYADLVRGNRVAQAARLRDQIGALAGDRSPDASARRGGFEVALTNLQGPWSGPVQIFGRLNAGTTTDRAASELNALARATWLARGDAKGAARIDVHLIPAASLRQHEDLDTLANVAMALLALVLLIACVNISNVLFAGAVARRREIGTRLALGAGQWRVVRQLLTESGVLSIAGGLCGLVLGGWLTPLLGRMLDVPPQTDLSLNRHVYAFAAICTTAVALGAGLLPALYGRRGGLSGAMKSTAVSGTTRLPAARLRALLVGGQTTAAILLLTCAALFTRALIHVTTVNLGFEPQQLMSVDVAFGSDYDGPRRLQFWERALDRVRQIPGVQDVAVAGYGPMGLVTAAGDVTVVATPAAGTGVLGDSLARFHRNFTTAGYFATIGLPISRGRSYTDDEVHTGAPVAVISESLARIAWGDASPLGSPLERVWGQDDAPGAPRRGFLSKPAGTRVIGVVPDAVTSILHPSTAMVYLPFDSSIFGPLLVRTYNPATVALPVQEALRSLDPNLRSTVSFVADGWREELRIPKALFMLALLLGLTSLVLALVGLFGISAFVVDLRRHEVSVRMALGATGAGVVRLLLRDCLRPVAVGTVVGLAIAPAAAKFWFLRVALFGVSPYDPWAMSGAVLLLSLTAAAAVFVPARRASRVDPVAVLKTE